jgi:hypothetical protein
MHPLHCIAIIIKDQMETVDMRTTDGSLDEPWKVEDRGEKPAITA